MPTHWDAQKHLHPTKLLALGQRIGIIERPNHLYKMKVSFTSQPKKWPHQLATYPKHLRSPKFKELVNHPPSSSMSSSTSIDINPKSLVRIDQTRIKYQFNISNPIMSSIISTSPFLHNQYKGNENKITFHSLKAFSRPLGSGYAKKSKKVVEEENSSEPSTEKSRTLDKVIKQIEQTFGKGTVMHLDASSSHLLGPEDVVSTGSLSLDLALGVGGLPRGRIVEIFGPESSGKTMLSLHVIANAQSNGLQCVFVDAEHALDIKWARNLGVQIENLLIAQPDSGEQALEIIDSLIQTGQVDVIVLDSVAALVPRVELEGEMGALQIGAQARLMSQAMRKLVGSLKKNRTLLIFLNQIRMKVGVMFGNPETTSGGNALKYYASVRLDIRRTGSIKKGDTIIANQVRVKVAKNKVAPPFRQAEFDVEFGRGISKVGELVDIGIKMGFLEKSGSWYTLTSNGAPLGQGREKVKAYLQENAKEAAKLEAAIREKCFSEQEESQGWVENESPPEDVVGEIMEEHNVAPQEQESVSEETTEFPE